MKTFNRVCIKTHSISDQKGNSLTIEKGKQYLTSEEKNKEVMVFSKYWVWLPVELFAGEEIFTKD